jgi:hypothetical protein
VDDKVMETREETGMRDVWSWSLSWFRDTPTSKEKRARQAALVTAIKRELAGIGTVPDLHDRYCQDSRWVLLLARERFPREWPTLGMHACTAAAFALRYVELVTGADLDATYSLPRWVGEWAIP